MAFGPSRHRAWVVGQRALECSLGSRGRSLGGLLEAVLRRLRGRLGAVLGPLVGFLWASWGHFLGPKKRRGDRLGPIFGAETFFATRKLKHRIKTIVFEHFWET